MVTKTIMQIEATPKSPEIIIKADGSVFLTGKSTLDNPDEFYTPIAEQIAKFESNFIGFEFDLNSIHESNIVPLIQLIETAKNNTLIKAIRYFWFYDPNVDAGYDMGKHFESALGIPCEFIVCA